MINRIDNYNCFEEQEFVKIQSILDKDSCTTLNKSNVINKIPYKEAVKEGMFKKVAWGEYLYSGRDTSFPDKYDFDDGSIWKVETDENGIEYLIKEVDEKDNIKRIASVKTANIVNNSNVNKIYKLLAKNDDDIFDYIMSDKNIKKMVFDKLNNDMELYVKEFLTKNEYIESKDVLEDILNIIKRMINTDDINSKPNLNDVIKTICEKTNTVESSFSFFKER